VDGMSEKRFTQLRRKLQMLFLLTLLFSIMMVVVDGVCQLLTIYDSSADTDNFSKASEGIYYF